MAPLSWEAARSKAERASFDYFKEELTITSGAMSARLMGVLDTLQDQEQRARSPDGTFPVIAHLSCQRADLGFLPTVQEAIRIAKTAKPEEEQLYLVMSVDSTSDLLLIELQANTSNGSPFFR
jgi:hypothetical protein